MTPLMTSTSDAPLLQTPLHALHQALGAKFVPFAGYDMPVQYKLGVLGEHLHTRQAAGLFDVSHMGQLRIDGADSDALLETLVPGDIKGLKPGRTRYTLLLGKAGGILDDVMVTRFADHLFMVVNAATKHEDIEHLQKHLGVDRVTPLTDRALLALQGPEAASVLASLAPETLGLGFMTAAPQVLAGIPCIVTRSGYTGEDGFEISVPADQATRLAERLLADARVLPIGLGARDSLRLEAGLCLYGHDIDKETSPIEADLAWTIGKRRREEGGFRAAELILGQLRDGPSRRRVGIKPDGRAPAREGTEIISQGRVIGRITSGGFGPSCNAPIAMGYVESRFAAPGTALELMVRGKALPAAVVPLPFIPHRYHRP
jgi:aminomethyltransferase